MQIIEIHTVLCWPIGWTRHQSGNILIFNWISEPLESSNKPSIACLHQVFDSGLIGEGCLHILQACKRNLLTSESIIIPMGASVFCQPIQLDRVFDVANCNVEHLNSFHWRSSYEGLPLKSTDHEWISLASPAMAFDFDFYDCDKNMECGDLDIVFDIEGSGVCNAIVFWFDLYLDEERTLSTSPYKNGIGPTWQQAVQFVDECRVCKGTQLRVKCSHDTYGIKFQVQRFGRRLLCNSSIACGFLHC